MIIEHKQNKGQEMGKMKVKMGNNGGRKVQHRGK